MAHLQPYARQGLAGYALLKAFQRRATPEGLVRRFFSQGPAPAYWAEVYADRSVMVGAWRGAIPASMDRDLPYPYALSFGGYLAPDHLQPEDRQRVDPSIAALIKHNAFWKEVADLCAQTPAVVATPDEARAQGALFPAWMPYDGSTHPGFDQAMLLCFAAARPFWQGPHRPVECWVESANPPGGVPHPGPLGLAGMRSDGYPFSLDEMQSPFARVFLAVLDAQPFWPAHSRLCTAWQDGLIGQHPGGKTIRSHVMEWTVPDMSAHAQLALVAGHQSLVAEACSSLDLPVASPA